METVDQLLPGMLSQSAIAIRFIDNWGVLLFVCNPAMLSTANRPHQGLVLGNVYFALSLISNSLFLYLRTKGASPLAR